MFRVKRPDVYKKRLDESDETSRRFFWYARHEDYSSFLCVEER